MDLYTFTAGGFRAAWRVLALDVRSRGHANIPDHGPVILASNHVGYLDFCFVALAAPSPRRQVRFLARHDIFDKPLVGAALRRMGQIPVDVHGDPAPAMRAAEERLRAGEIIGMHPEGTISPSFVPRAGRTGTVRLAQLTGAPIVPVAVWGSQRLLTKGLPVRLRRNIPVVVRYGQPHVPTGDPGEATRRLMGEITDLLGVAQAEYPQQPAPGDEWWLPHHLGGTAPTPEEAEERIRRQVEERRRRALAEREDPPAADETGGSEGRAAS